MRQKRQINGRNIINDLRSGMTDRELQMKYRLSTNGLCSIYEKLIDRETISHSELSEWSPLYSLRTLYKESRSYPRANLATRVPIYDLGTGSIGILRDISEKGMRVAGIDASVGQAKPFQIPIDMFMQADPLLIVAECKWAKPRGKMTEYVVAGFEIIDLPANDRNTLQNFMTFLLLSESGHWKTLGGTEDSHDLRVCK
ncbi:MAG: PilZ domain-containing protein [Desulfomonilaceae bacterium]